MKNFFDMVFSFNGFLCLLIVIMFSVIMTAFDSYRYEENFCYSQNMVRVRTDAGPRCVLPNALLEIK
jgi:hypothetical protein